MKRLADQKGVDLLVVDTGDRIEGTLSLQSPRSFAVTDLDRQWLERC